MPLVTPRTGSSNKALWSVVKKDNVFSVLHHKTPSIWPSFPYRVTLSYTGYILAEAKTEDEILYDYAQLKTQLDHSRLNLSGQSEASAASLIFKFFEAPLSQTKHATSVSIEPEPIVTSNPALSGSEIFSFLDTSTAYTSPPEKEAGIFDNSDVLFPAYQPTALSHSPPNSAPSSRPSTPPSGSNSPASRPSTPPKSSSESPPLLSSEPLAPSFRLTADSINDSIVPVSAQLEPGNEVILEGWLSKKRTQNVVGKLTKNKPQWRDYYFVLYLHAIFYYSDELESSFPLNIEGQDKCLVVVSSLRVPATVGSFIGYEFILENSKGQQHFATTTLTDLNSWFDFFHSCSNLPYFSVNRMKKSGWLYTNMNNKWHKMWIQTENGLVSIHKRQEKGFFPLTGCSIETHGLEITATSSGNVLTLKPATNNWSAWLSALRKAVTTQTSSITSDSSSIELQRDAYELRMIIQEAILVDQLEGKSRPPSTSKPRSPLFKILSIDGGGLRGIMSSIILQRIMKVFPDFLDQFDMITGCSNGAIIAASLSFGHTPGFCRSVLESTGRIIFRKDGSLSSINGARHTNTNLKMLCDTIWGNKKLKDATKMVVIPAFLLDNQNPDPKHRTSEIRYFDNFTGTAESGANDLVSDIIMRTTAAPTYFPAWQNYVDGGMFAQDPSTGALTLAMSHRNGGLGKCVDDIALFSIGTGLVKRYYEDQQHDWGYVQWIPKLLNVLWDGMVLKSINTCSSLLGDRYWRVDTELENDIAMDDPAQVPTLVPPAENLDLTTTLNWISKTMYP
ncbi:patatin family protein [Pelomyxa schiedti]|nr:patatin family protein [Pelomyxa schiedti]